MKAKGRGRIVNISSRASLGRDKRTAYAASKAGIIGMTRSWAVELGPQGITVNAVAPGPIATEMLASNNEPAALARKAELVPVGRLGEPRSEERSVGQAWVSTCKSRESRNHKKKK